ncbi:hypothetical protein [Streptomyces sp900116325]|uniref:hypothetical protein n=1 Tax=Streptomyces sp. 900116325 TaxID=3154295 RepID=UPI00331F2D63
MRTRITAAALVAAGLLATLTACGSSDDSDGKPTPTVTATATRTVDSAAARQGCVDAWADTISNRPSDFDPDTDTDPEPAECKGLPEDDWTDRYMEGLHASNQRGIDALQDRIDEASEAAQQP